MLFEELEHLVPRAGQMDMFGRNPVHVPLVHVLREQDELGSLVDRLGGRFEGFPVGSSGEVNAFPAVVYGAHRVRMLRDHHDGPTVPEATARPMQAVGSLSILRISVDYNDIRVKGHGRAIMLVGLTAGCMVGRYDIPRKNFYRLPPLVVHDLNREVHPSQTGGFLHVLTHVIAENLGHADGGVGVMTGYGLVKVTDRVDPGHSRQDGYSRPLHNQPFRAV